MGTADRPFMPGYGILPADRGSGLLPWSEAERRLSVAHDYWLATVCPTGAPEKDPAAPHASQARRGALQRGRRSRKARNLAAEPRCTITTDDARDPVVVEGAVERLVDAGSIVAFVAAVNAKYDAVVTVEFQDPDVNGTFRVRPVRVFALSGADFIGSPTRWRCPEPDVQTTGAGP